MKKILFFLMLTSILWVCRINAQVTVLNETFEIPGLPTGWTTIDANNDGQTWAHNSTSFFDGHNSDGSYYSSSQGGVTPDDWLVTQAINLGTSSTLTFWRMFGFRKYDHFGVYVSTTSASDPSAFTLLYEETLTGDNYAWQQKTVPLNNYDNETVYIAFRHFNCTNQFGIMLDDILVTSTMASSVITVEPSTLQFVDVPAGTPSAGQLVTVNAVNLTDLITVSVNPPFEVSTDSLNYTQTVTMQATDHDLYVRYSPYIAGLDSGEVTLTSGTASASVNLFGNCIACDYPSELSVSTVTSTSAVVSWGGSADFYNIYYKAASDTDWTAIEYILAEDTSGYTLDELTPSTSYTCYVAAVCGDGSTINSIETSSFTTSCSAYTAPYTQNFDNNSLPQCWNRNNGWASEVFAGSGLIPVTSGWRFNNTHVFGEHHACLNICNTNCNRWLVTPPIDLDGLANPALIFEIALTAWNNAGAITPNSQPDDKFMVIISTDDGATWSAANATVWSNDGNGDYVYDQIPTAGQEITIALDDYVNQTVRIAFYGESTVTNGDNDLHIDNVMIYDANSCTKPTSLTVTNVASNSATLSWTENGTATAWNIEYGPTGYQQGSSAATTVQADTIPFTINNLSATSYDFYVQANCGDEQSLWVGPISAYPGSYNMGLLGSDTLTTCDLIVYDNGGFNDNYTAYCDYTLVLFPEVSGNSIAVSGNFHTESCCDYLRLYDGVGTNGTMYGEYKGTGTIPTSVASSGPMTIVFHSDGGLQYEGFELNVSCVSCIPPTNLTASNISNISAELNWTGSSSLYTVEYKAENETAWTTETTSDTTLLLSNLQDYTVYTVNVYSDCSGTLSPAATTTFTTMMTSVDIPFSTNFSNPTEWAFNNGNCSNRWTIRAVSDTANALFVTTNNNTPGYNTSSVSVVSAEKLFTIGTTEELEISFDVQIGGDEDFDYLKVFLAPVDETYPASTSLTTSYASSSFNTYAVNFTDYLQYSGYTSLPYKFNLTQGNTVHVTVVMPNPNTNPDANSTAKLVFLWRNDHNSGVQPGAIVRNVSIAPLACPAPTNLSVMNITGSSADISWDAASTEENWILEYRASGDTTWTSVQVSNTPTYSLSGLTVGIPYQVRVQTVCDVNVQSLWISTMFTTFCDAVTTFPFTEDFEHNGLMPDCWSQEYVYNNVNWAFQAGGHNNGYIHNAHSGSYNAFFFAESEDGLTTRLVTPILDLSGMTEAYVTLWYAQQVWGNNQDQLYVYYRSNPNDPWQMLTLYYGTINTWTRDSLDLPNLSATYQLAFVGIANHGFGVLLDDITIDGSNTPPVVTDPTVLTIAASGVTQTTAILNATINNPDNVTITDKGFEWKPADGSTYTQIAGTGSDYTFYASLSGLTANTEYRFKAYITYEGGTIYGDEISFTTSGVGIDNITLANSISLMPNPADNYIELSINSNVEVKEAIVYNAFGQMIQMVKLNDNHTRINLSNMAAGMSFVRVNGDNVSATKKFIKR